MVALSHLTEEELKVLEKLQFHDMPGLPEVIQRLVAEIRLCWKEMTSLCPKCGLPMVGVDDICYCHEDREQGHEGVD
jgi:hypothetical protein